MADKRINEFIKKAMTEVKKRNNTSSMVQELVTEMNIGEKDES